MALARQIIDTDTGEVKSFGVIEGNANFVMLFKSEISSIVQIQKDDPKAGALFMFLLEHMDKDNALIVSLEAMSEILGWGKATVSRKVKYLKDKNFITTQRTGNSSVYFVNANIAWTTYANKKEYATFKASVLISKSEQQHRLKSSRFKQLDLIDDNNKD